MRSPALILAIGIIVNSFGVAAAAPVHLWSKRFGSTGPDAAYALAVDGAGNAVITGTFNQYVDFGGGPLLSAGVDMFLAKYNPSGVHQWSKAFTAVVHAVAVDGPGNVVVTGYCINPVDFGGGLLTGNSADMFIARFDANGVHQWSKRLPGIRGFGVAMDGAGNIIVVGVLWQTVNLGGGPLTSAGGSDILLVKYDPSGAHLWSKRFGGTTDDTGKAVTADGSGNVVVTGVYVGTVSFGGAPLTSVGGRDIFLAKYDGNGVHQWSKSFVGASGDYCEDVAVDGAGNVVITGEFYSTADFGGGVMTSAGGSDIFLARYDANGVHQWSKRLGGTDARDLGTAIDTDGSGRIAVTGSFGSTVDFGGGPLTSAGGWDIYVAEYDASGAHRWSQRFGDVDYWDIGEGVSLDDVGGLVFSGYFNRTVDFGGGPLTSPGYEDIYLAKYHEQLPVPVLFTRFDAIARDAAIDIEWDVASDEALESFTLYRRAERAAQPVVVATGDPRTTHSYTDVSVEPGSTYHFELVIRTVDGTTFRSPVATVTVGAITTSIGPNYPNPFNPRTTIEYTVSARMPVTIEIVDVSGALVARLEQGVRTAGTHRVEWDGRDTAGRPVGSGVYFYRLSGARGVAAGKMILVK